jgi:hypothetical protein
MGNDWTSGAYMATSGEYAGESTGLRLRRPGAGGLTERDDLHAVAELDGAGVQRLGGKSLYGHTSAASRENHPERAGRAPDVGGPAAAQHESDPAGERITFDVMDTTDEDRWIDSLDWEFDDGMMGTG